MDSKNGVSDIQLKALEAALVKVNEVGHLVGLPKMDLINPNDCVGQDKNARYFDPEVFQQLVDNIKADGRLESVPLVYQEEEHRKYMIISGHHRVEAAKQAGLSFIYVFVITPKDRDEILQKQLSHNALVGKDDKMVLKELFEEIDSIEQKMKTGLSSEIESLQYTSLNFKVGTFKELTLLFVEPDMNKLEELMEELSKSKERISGETVHLIHKDYFDTFAERLRQIKKVENIKNNGTAFMRMLSLAEEQLECERIMNTQDHGEE